MPDVLPILFAVATTLSLLGAGPVLGADQGSNDKWKAQDSWERFSDREASGAFKPSKPKSGTAGDSLLAPVVSRKSTPIDEGRSFVLMPAADPAPAQPQVHVETTYVPAGHQQVPYVPTYFGNPGGIPGGGYANPYGYGYRPGYRYGYGLGGAPAFGWGGPFSFGLGGGTSPGYRPITQITQTGPSKAAGDYYSPATVDSTASGNYFASPTGLPKLAPIIHEQAPPSDYWGSDGSALPDSLRP